MPPAEVGAKRVEGLQAKDRPAALLVVRRDSDAFGDAPAYWLVTPALGHPERRDLPPVESHHLGADHVDGERIHTRYQDSQIHWIRGDRPISLPCHDAVHDREVRARLGPP